MQVRLQQIGQNLGFLVPAYKLESLAIKAGDLVNLKITKNKVEPRQGWEDPQLWQGAQNEPLYLGDSPNSFDAEDWQW